MTRKYRRSLIVGFLATISTAMGREKTRGARPPRDPLSYIEDEEESYFAEKKAAYLRGTSTLDRDVKRYIEDNHAVAYIYATADDDSDDFLDHYPGLGYSGTWIMKPGR